MLSVLGSLSRKLHSLLNVRSWSHSRLLSWLTVLSLHETYASFCCLGRLGPWGVEYHGPAGQREQQPGGPGGAVGPPAGAGDAGLLGEPGRAAGEPAAPAPGRHPLPGHAPAPEQQRLQYGPPPPGMRAPRLCLTPVNKASPG